LVAMQSARRTSCGSAAVKQLTRVSFPNSFTRNRPPAVGKRLRSSGYKSKKVAFTIRPSERTAEGEIHQSAQVPVGNWSVYSGAPDERATALSRHREKIPGGPTNPSILLDKDSSVICILRCVPFSDKPAQLISGP
jgi:hypothetical protein